MGFDKALRVLAQGGKVRRPCWQPGWLEAGTFQGHTNQIFYKNPKPVMIAGYEMPVFCMTYYVCPADAAANDWVSC